MKTTTAILLAGVAIGLGTAAASLVPWYYEQQKEEAIKTAEKERQKKSRERSAERERKAKWVEKGVYLKHIVYQEFLKRRANSPYVALVNNERSGRFYCLSKYNYLLKQGNYLDFKKANIEIRDEFADSLITAWNKDKLIMEHFGWVTYDSLREGNYSFPEGIDPRGCHTGNNILFRKNRQFSK